MKLFKILATTLLLTISTANAAPTWQWHFNVKIKTVMVFNHGSVVIMTFDKPHSACKNPAKWYWVQVKVQQTREKGMQDMLSVALTAAAAGKLVDVYFDSNSGACYIERIHAKF